VSVGVSLPLLTSLGYLCWASVGDLSFLCGDVGSLDLSWSLLVSLTFLGGFNRSLQNLADLADLISRVRYHPPISWLARLVSVV
jgi:hypothetical protein